MYEYVYSVLMWFPDSRPPVAESVLCVSAHCLQRNGVSAVLNAAHLFPLSAGVTTHLVHLQKSHTHTLVTVLTHPPAWPKLSFCRSDSGGVDVGVVS